MAQFSAKEIMDTIGADIITAIAAKLSPPDFIAFKSAGKYIREICCRNSRKIWASISQREIGNENIDTNESFCKEILKQCFGSNHKINKNILQTAYYSKYIWEETKSSSSVYIANNKLTSPDYLGEIWSLNLTLKSDSRFLDCCSFEIFIDDELIASTFMFPIFLEHNPNGYFFEVDFGKNIQIDSFDANVELRVKPDGGRKPNFTAYSSISYARNCLRVNKDTVSFFTGNAIILLEPGKKEIYASKRSLWEIYSNMLDHINRAHKLNNKHSFPAILLFKARENFCQIGYH